VTVVTFRPLLDAAALDAGDGRCLIHPGKDAVDVCERCGAYACDVCVTRTGEHVLCPGCFDLLHGRGELETTRPRRMRWDRLCLPLYLVGSFCFAPFALAGFALAVYVLWRRRRDPWMEVRGAVWAMVITLIPIAVIVLAMAAETAT
jgi:hypothetical protein